MTSEAGRFDPRRATLGKAIKMKVSFKQRIRDWLFDESDMSNHAISVDEDGPEVQLDNAINFSVVNAAGGRIVQVRYYDQKSDRHKNSLHVITPDEDLSTALAHILAIETISR